MKTHYPKEHVVHYFFFAAILSWLLVNVVPAHAQGSLYKWVDSQGNIHYTNAPTGKNVQEVNDALPPASNFQSPSPPEETAKADTEATKSKLPSGGDTPTPPANGEESTSEDTPDQANQEPQASSDGEGEESGGENTPEQARAEPGEETQDPDSAAPEAEDQQPTPTEAADNAEASDALTE